MSRTNYTSETLRLESNNSVCNKESDRTNNQHLQAGVINASQGFQKKKVSSFQITSIRPTSRSSNDGADDSENDTEDTSDILDSSRVTIDLDQETPSYSEDYSKSEDLLLGAGPVIPTNSQYGITALVQQTGTSGMMTARLPQGVTVNVTESGLALAKADGEPDDLDNWQKRFKIVKIDSTEPFKRGRWICLDFMDSPALNSSENKSEEGPNLVVSNVVLSDGDSSETRAPLFVQIPLSLSSTVQYPPMVSHPLPNQFTGQLPTASAVATTQVPSVQGSVHYAPSTGQPVQVVVPIGFTGSQPQQASVHPTPVGQTSTPASSSSQPIPSNVHSSNEVQTTSGINTCLSQGTIIGIQPVIPTHSISSSHSQQSEQPTQTQGVNIPQNNLGGGHINQNLSSQVIGMNQPSAVIQQQQQSQQPSQQHPQQSQQQPISNQGIPASVSSAQQISQPNAAQMHQTQLQSSQHTDVNQTLSSGQQITSSQTSSAASQLPSGSSVTSTIQAASYTSLPGTGATPTPATTPAQTQMSLATGQSSIQTESLPQILSQGGSFQSNATSQINPSSLEGISGTNQGGETSETTTATPPTGAAAGSEEAESASTASTVAIDNKIEQAMDLVKSHLMFAVREEVDVLKDRIVELMDRIKHLECENTILRQYASPEVLQQLQSQMPHQMQQPAHHSSTS